MATDRLINSTQGDSIIGKLDDIKTAINNQSTAATATPLMDGAAAVGTSTKYARENHVHPTDTSRAANVMSTYAIDTARENITNSSTVQSAIEQLEYREKTNKNNILLLTANGGGKNYFNPQSVTYEPSDANITYSLSGDTITLSVTTLSNVSELNIKGINFPLNKDLVLTGCPANTGYTIQIDAFNNSAYISGSADTGSGSQPFRFTTMTNSRLRIRIGTNTSFTNLQFKIMVRDSNTDSTYQPYAMSNAELTSAIQALQAQLNQ